MFNSPAKVERVERHEARLRGAGTKPVVEAFAISFDAFTKRGKDVKMESLHTYPDNRKRKANSSEQTNLSQPPPPQHASSCNDRPTTKRRRTLAKTTPLQRPPLPASEVPIEKPTLCVTAKERKAESSVVLQQGTPSRYAEAFINATPEPLRSTDRNDQPKLKSIKRRKHLAGDQPCKEAIDVPSDLADLNANRNTVDFSTAHRAGCTTRDIDSKAQTKMKTKPARKCQGKTAATTSVSDRHSLDDIIASVEPELEEHVGAGKAAESATNSAQPREVQRKSAPKRQTKVAATAPARPGDSSFKHPSPTTRAGKASTTAERRAVKKPAHPDKALSERSANLPSPKKSTARKGEAPMTEDDLDWLFDTDPAQAKTVLTRSSHRRTTTKTKTKQSTSRKQSQVEEMDLDDLVSNIALFAPPRLKT